MISLICKKYKIENYTVNDDGLIDVDGDVDLNYKNNSDGSIDVNGDVILNYKNLTQLPLNFNRVTGYFNCSRNKLTSLKGSPRWVGGYFYCSHNQLTSLEFSPDYVGGWFDCRWNNLTNNYCETEIGSSFCTSLEQDGLTNNYNEWRKLYKRKLILNDIFNM